MRYINIIFPFKYCFSVFMVLLSLPSNAEAAGDAEEENLPQMSQPAHPSKGVIIAVLSTMFLITFLLLLYVRFCRVSTPSSVGNSEGLTRSRSRVSGIDKKVIQTLPFFKFSSLKGLKEGLECSVCLSKFEDTESLRLLPKCKHAFHMNCIDTWLERHSTCPLCRHRVEAGDIKSFNYSFSSRSLRVPSNLTEDRNLEIFVQREPCHEEGDSSGGGGGGVRKWEKPLHVRNHKILVVSDFVTRSRWSDLNSSDMLSLNCEMMNDMCCSSNSSSSRRTRLCSSNEEENSLTALNSGEKRSMSEMANVPRFAAEMRCREERLRSVWLPIARRTVEWFARQERSSDERELQHRPLASIV